MLRTFGLAAVVAIGFLSLSRSGSAQPDMTEQAVRQVAQKGCEAFRKDDFKEFLKVADVPWCAWGNLDADGYVIEKRDDLFTWLGMRFGGNDTTVSFATTKAMPYKLYRKMVVAKDQKMMDQALTPTDWVVWYTVTGLGGKEEAHHRLFVARRDGQWKIVGWDGREPE